MKKYWIKKSTATLNGHHLTYTPIMKDMFDPNVRVFYTPAEAKAFSEDGKLPSKLEEAVQYRLVKDANTIAKFPDNLKDKLN